jgi:hypothetical protein
MSDQHERHQWWLTPTALFRSHMPPVFLRPVHWLDGCWTCAPQSPLQQQALELEGRRLARQARSFRFDPDPPNLGALRDAMAAAHPDHGGSDVAFQAAHERWREAMKRAHGHTGWVNKTEIETGQRPKRKDQTS